ncbi:conserved hypothetical protein [Microsporum canis CBS 113480]|uniref:Uncharacterized protein n=1 Tax=Arthroderma otae (strain ATCC MYA-4605 / CBS 113480) TaxID=554155 RepID=C5FR85_ARTOC|nr:conserved hypothetical protein [Microsporum canis CBS 113480]EEQ32388.1 conserved hypothetical protein [Microsporum canis CBS 113480]
MPLFNTNISAFNVTATALLRNPSLLIPHLTIPTFLQLPDDLSYHLIDSAAPKAAGARPPTIRALVIDKDNTLTPPHNTGFPHEYYEKLRALRTSESSPFNMMTNPDGILIVSNTAGSDPRSKHFEEDADKIEESLRKLRIRVYRSPERRAGAPLVKKPLSYSAVLKFLLDRGVVERAEEVAIVGDRVGTDVLMASLMGAWSVWTRDGVTQDLGGRTGKNYRGMLANSTADGGESYSAKAMAGPLGVSSTNP